MRDDEVEDQLRSLEREIVRKES